MRSILYSVTATVSSLNSPLSSMHVEYIELNTFNDITDRRLTIKLYETIRLHI